MNLVFLTWRDLANPAAGGAEVMFDRLMYELADRGHNVTLLCGAPASSSRRYRVVAAGGTYSQYILIPLLCASKYRRADVVIDTENGFPYFSPLWRRRPLICVVHHLHRDQWATRFPRPIAWVCRNIETHLMPRVYRRKTFVAISKSTAGHLQEIGIDRARIRVIEPGVDRMPHDLKVETQEPLYLSLNRLVPHKRIDILIRAWELAAREIPGRLVIAGDGPELGTLTQLAATVPRVQVMGRVSEQEKRKLLRASEFLVTSSHHEGWGLSVLEAATYGTPTLAVDGPGIRDAIDDGVTGVLVRGPEASIVQNLAIAWVALATDSRHRKLLGNAAQTRSRLFAWKLVVDKWIRVLEEVGGTGSHRNFDHKDTPTTSGCAGGRDK